MWKVITFPLWKVITFRIFDAGSKTEFTNNSLKTPKIGKLNNDTLITPQGLMIHEKTQTKKSHATVPLRLLYPKRVYKFGVSFFSIKIKKSVK